ncbi:hypothetical protein [Saccharothrix stipae]
MILTSRLRDTALTRGGHRLVELDVFTEAEAVAYLAGALAVGVADGGDLTRLRGLAGDLAWLPLALGQAAAFIVDQPLLTVAAYRRMPADRRRTLTELTPPEDALPEHQATVAATWSLSIDRADLSAGGAAAWPAHCLSWPACSTPTARRSRCSPARPPATTSPRTSTPTTRTR